jgi:hypothetical protein
VDLAKAIRELCEEKKRLDAVIASLELMLAAESKLPPLRPRSGRKRGRKSMSREERLQVSERMKKYWASRRDENHDGGEASAETAGASVTAA